MINNEFLAKIAGLGFFHRWHPEVALRYLPIVENLKHLEKGEEILEVGSGGLGIAPYLGRHITGADTNFQKPFHHLVKRIKASATNLPFADSSFGIVISVDMLEHLKKEERAKAIKEIFRVARKKVLIGVPCGKLSYLEDIRLQNYYISHYGKRYPFLEEQIKFGLPEKEEISGIIRDTAKILGKKIKLKVIGNENLSLHSFLMKGWMSNDFIKNIFYRKILLFALPVLKHMNQDPVYRQLFFVDIL